MLKDVFGVYVNPDVVGWVTREAVYTEKSDTDKSDLKKLDIKKSDIKHSEVTRITIIEVFSTNGTKILRQELMLGKADDAAAQNRLIDHALENLGYTKPVGG